MMKKENKIKGQKYEILAQNYLKKHGFSIIATNVSNFCGEIDIVAKQKDTYVFVEVKGRGSNAFGAPYEAVTPYKQKKIRRAAQAYLKSKHLLDRCEVRFDVISILDDEIEHLIDAF